MVRLVELHYIPCHLVNFNDSKFLTKCTKDKIYCSSKGNVTWARDGNSMPVSQIIHQTTGISLDKLEKLCIDCKSLEDLIVKLDSNSMLELDIDNETYVKIKNYNAKSINSFPYKNILSTIKDLSIKFSEIKYCKTTKLYIVSQNPSKFYIKFEKVLIDKCILDTKNIIERVKNSDGSIFLNSYMLYDSITFHIKVKIVGLDLHPMAGATFFKPDLDISTINHMSGDYIVSILGYSSPKNTADVEKLVCESQTNLK